MRQGFGWDMLILSITDVETLDSYQGKLITITTCKYHIYWLYVVKVKLWWCIVLKATLKLNVYGHMKLLESI